VIGAVPDEALQEALAEAARISSTDADLIVASVDSPESLHTALREAKAQLLSGVPIWMVYAKGPGHAINETAIRSLLRENGMIDTKVASVSAKFTALRFNYRKSD
jgi:predicted deacylase